MQDDKRGDREKWQTPQTFHMQRVGEQVGLVLFMGGGAQVWGGAQEFRVGTLHSLERCCTDNSGLND